MCVTDIRRECTGDQMKKENGETSVFEIIIESSFNEFQKTFAFSIARTKSSTNIDRILFIVPLLIKKRVCIQTNKRE